MRRMRQVYKILAALALVVMMTMAACTSAPSPSPTPTPTPTPSPTPTPTPTPTPPSYTANIASKAGVGNYLVDSKGMTLYYFTRDVVGKSNAPGTVLQAWPIFYTQNLVVPSSLNAADFSTIMREDGQKQSTYKGWPLYYYARDQAAGDTLGDGVNGIWFLMKIPFYTVMLQTKTAVGNYLADAKGMTLYWTTRDSVGQSNITGATLANWPVFYTSNIVVSSALSAADFSSITRSDGSAQTTYKGWPLYYYIQDKVSGDTLGQGVGGVWFTVSPAASGPAPLPTLTITSPANGATLPAGDITVTIQVTNFNIVDKQGQANVPGEGHVHYFLDVDAPTTPGQPAIPPSGIWAHVAATTYTFTNVASGTHAISVELVNNDHTPLVPAVVAKVTITVTAAGGGGGGGY